MVTLADLTEPWAPGEAPWLDRLDQVNDLHPGGICQAWQDNGFVILESFIDDATINAYQQAWRADNADRPGGWPYDVPYMHVPAVKNLVCYPPLAVVLQMLIGEPMGVHLNLTGWRSTTRDWHQDGYLNPDSNQDHYAAVWFALDDIHPDAGPFQYHPGSHRDFAPIRQTRMLRALGPDEQGPDWPRHSERILTPLFEQHLADPPTEFLAKRGDILIWHSRLLHRGSVPIDPDMERRACIAHYSGIRHRPDMPHPAQPHEVYSERGWFFPIDQGAHR